MSDSATTPNGQNFSIAEAEERIRDVLVREVPGAKEASFDSTLATLGVDSLGAIEIAFEIERVFGISLANHEISATTTARDLARLVVGKCA